MDEKNPHFFKQAYTQEEIEEILEWFASRMDKLPETMQINASTYSENLQRSTQSLIDVVKYHKKDLSVVYYGYVSYLYLIRYRLQQMGIE